MSSYSSCCPKLHQSIKQPIQPGTSQNYIQNSTNDKSARYFFFDIIFLGMTFITIKLSLSFSDGKYLITHQNYHKLTEIVWILCPGDHPYQGPGIGGYPGLWCRGCRAHVISANQIRYGERKCYYAIWRDHLSDFGRTHADKHWRDWRARSHVG